MSLLSATGRISGTASAGFNFAVKQEQLNVGTIVVTGTQGHSNELPEIVIRNKTGPILISPGTLATAEGNITVIAKNSITLSQGSQILAHTSPGNLLTGGNIFLGANPSATKTNATDSLPPGFLLDGASNNNRVFFGNGINTSGTNQAFVTTGNFVQFDGVTGSSINLNGATLRAETSQMGPLEPIAFVEGVDVSRCFLSQETIHRGESFESIALCDPDSKIVFNKGRVDVINGKALIMAKEKSVVLIGKIQIELAKGSCLLAHVNKQVVALVNVGDKSTHSILVKVAERRFALQLGSELIFGQTSQNDVLRLARKAQWSSGQATGARISLPFFMTTPLMLGLRKSTLKQDQAWYSYLLKLSAASSIVNSQTPYKIEGDL